MEFMKDHVPGEGTTQTVKKLFVNVLADAAKNYNEAVMDNKSMEECINKAKEGALSGLVNWGVETGISFVSDKLVKDGFQVTGDIKYNSLYKVKGLDGEDAAKWSYKLVESGFLKETVTNDSTVNAVNTLITDVTQNMTGDWLGFDD